MCRVGIRGNAFAVDYCERYYLELGRGKINGITNDASSSNLDYMIALIQRHGNSMSQVDIRWWSAKRRRPYIKETLEEGISKRILILNEDKYSVRA